MSVKNAGSHFVPPCHRSGIGGEGGEAAFEERENGRGPFHFVLIDCLAKEFLCELTLFRGWKSLDVGKHFENYVAR